MYIYTYIVHLHGSRFQFGIKHLQNLRTHYKQPLSDSSMHSSIDYCVSSPEYIKHTVYK